MPRAQKKVKLTKKGMFVILVLIVTIVAIVVFSTKDNKKQDEQKNDNTEIVKENDEGAKYNTSEKLKETKTFNGYEISNIELSKEEETEFNAKITNVTEAPIGNKSIYIVFKDKNGGELYKMQVYVSEIQPGKSVLVNSAITEDIVEAYDLEIQF